jgi:hypothetical protein
VIQNKYKILAGDKGAGGRTTLKWISEISIPRMENGFISLRRGSNGGFCGHGMNL